MATTHRAGDLLEELLLSGALTIDDLASAAGIPVTDDLVIDVDGDTVTVTS